MVNGGIGIDIDSRNNPLIQDDTGLTTADDSRDRKWYLNSCMNINIRIR